MRCAFAMASVVLLAVTPAGGQDAGVSPLSDLVESLAPAAEISGTPVIGIVSPGTRGQGNVIVARIPAAWAGAAVCARVVSSDGRYEALRSFSVRPDWPGGLATMDFPTRFGAELAEFADVELGIGVAAGRCDSPETTLTIVPAAWNSADLGSGGLLLVNSFRAEETYLLAGQLSLDITCQPLDSSKRTAFDSMCPLPQSLFESGLLVEVELNRIRRGSLMLGEVFVIDAR